MKSIEEREQNLFNATDTLAQFYEEIESFLGILFSSLERAGFTAKGERLRSGTFTTNNLSRRLLASATTVYVKGIGPDDEEPEDDEPDEGGADGSMKTGKEEVPITEGLVIPFATVSLFTPRTIPSVTTLSSPLLIIGALGDMSFVEKKTGNPGTPETPVMSLSNLANMPVGQAKKQGDRIIMNCWRPKRMNKFKMQGKCVGFQKIRLLEIDSHEKIASIASTLVSFCRKT